MALPGRPRWGAYSGLPLQPAHLDANDPNNVNNRPKSNNAEDSHRCYDRRRRIIGQRFPHALLQTSLARFKARSAEIPGIGVESLRYQPLMTERGSGSRKPLQAEDMASSDRSRECFPRVRRLMVVRDHTMCLAQLPITDNWGVNNQNEA